MTIYSNPEEKIGMTPSSPNVNAKQSVRDVACSGGFDFFCPPVSTLGRNLWNLGAVADKIVQGTNVQVRDFRLSSWCRGLSWFSILQQKSLLWDISKWFKRIKQKSWGQPQLIPKFLASCGGLWWHGLAPGGIELWKSWIAGNNNWLFGRFISVTFIWSYFSSCKFTKLRFSSSAILLRIVLWHHH